MITSFEIAEQVHEKVRDSFEVLVSTTALVKENCSVEEYQRYREVIGRIGKIVMFDILEPLYKEQPGLKPQAWDDL